MNQPVDDALRTFIVNNFLFGQNGSALSDQQSFLETGVIDSTGFLELIAFVEQQFGIAVDDRELVPENFDSLDKVRRFVAGKQAHLANRIDA